MWKVPESRRCEPISWKTSSLFLFLTFTCGVSTTLVANIGQSSLPLYHCPRHISIFGIIYKGLYLAKGWTTRSLWKTATGRMSVPNRPVRHECLPQKNQQSQPSFWYFTLRWWWERKKSNSLGHTGCQPAHFSEIKVMTMKRENTSAFLYTHTTSQMYITICMTPNYTKHNKNIYTHILFFGIITMHNHPAKSESLNNYMILHGFFNFRIQSFQKEPLDSNHGDPLRTIQSCRFWASSINLA